jgi:hypothetical protein
MKKYLIYLFTLLVISLNTPPAFASWMNLTTCENLVSVSYQTSVGPSMSSATKTLFRVEISNKDIIHYLDIKGSHDHLELFDSSFSTPQYSRLSFTAKGGTDLKIKRIEGGSLFRFEVVSPQQITCLQEVCTSGCYAGDSPNWECVDLQVIPETILHKETAYCKIEQSF